MNNEILYIVINIVGSKKFSKKICLKNKNLLFQYFGVVRKPIKNNSIT